MYSHLFQIDNQDVNRPNQDFVYLVNTPEISSAFETIEQVLKAIEPFVIEESLSTGETDLFYEIPYFLDCQGYAQGQSWAVSLAPRL
ncbi:MAG: hypothetical protein AB4290_17305 [Spirulina sp.]